MRLPLLTAVVLFLSISATFAVDEGTRTFQLNASRTATIPAPVQKSQVTESYDRPSWIPARAFTKDEMIAYYGVKAFGLKYSWRLPAQPTTARLGKGISMWWKGYCPDKCKIRIEPDPSAPKGNFTFHTIGADGPRGWLQATGIKDATGWQYRYWFDQPR